jgi:hypothetical protein
LFFRKRNVEKAKEEKDAVGTRFPVKKAIWENAQKLTSIFVTVEQKWGASGKKALK